MEHNKYDLILLDVDNKDPSVGMSCPPKQFVTPEILLHIRDNCLRREGGTSKKKGTNDEKHGLQYIDVRFFFFFFCLLRDFHP